MGSGPTRFASRGPALHVTAVDLSEQSLDIARRRAEVYGLDDRIDFYCADAEQLADVVPREPFDLVYSFGVIHHTPNPERAIQQIREHFVHSDTVFKLMVYNRRSWKVLWILLTEGRGAFWKLDELVARNSEAQTRLPGHLHLHALRSESVAAGIRGTRSSIDFIFPYRIPTMSSIDTSGTGTSASSPQRLFRRLERLLGWHLCITAHPSPR